MFSHDVQNPFLTFLFTELFHKTFLPNFAIMKIREYELILNKTHIFFRIMNR